MSALNSASSRSIYKEYNYYLHLLDNEIKFIKIFKESFL